MAEAPVCLARACHHPRLQLRLVLPEVCDVPKMFLHPLVGIDGVQVAFASIVKNERRRCAASYPILYLFYSHENSPRRAASENGLAPHQAATTHDTFQVGHPHALIGQICAEKLRASGRAVSRNEPLGWLSAKN